MSEIAIPEPFDERPARLAENTRARRAEGGAPLADALLLLALETAVTDLRQSTELLNEAQELIEEIGYMEGHYRAALVAGRLDLAREDFAGAERRADYVLEQARKSNQPLLEGYAYCLSAAIHEARGEVGEAAAVGLLALDHLAETQDVYAMGVMTELVGRCCEVLDEPGTAADYIERAIEYHQESGSFRSLARNHIRLALSLCQTGELESAESQLAHAEKLINAYSTRHARPPYTDAMGELWLNRARLHARRAGWQAALSAAEAGIAAGPWSAPVERALLLCKGQILLSLEAFEEAEATLFALVARDDCTPRELAQAHEALSQIFEQRGAYTDALIHSEQFHAHDKKWFFEQHAQQVAMTQRLLETRSARREAELLARKNSELEAVVSKLRALHEHVQDLSRRDGLTGLYNRRYLDEQLPALIVAAQSADTPLSILMGDLDDFKAVNDRHRHQTGDRVLQEVGRLLERIAQRMTCHAFAVRYGGEEFALVMPGIPLERAQRIAQAFCRRLRARQWGAIADGLRMTISVGVADSHGVRHTDDLMHRVDEAMYAAKRAGKDRVCHYHGTKGEGSQ